MRTLFIADLHLSENNPAITSAFYHFLDTQNKQVDALYILGDMFEVWIGDDEHTPLMDEVAQALSHYSASNNIAIYYLHGNRDFMIGKRYAKQASMQLLAEHTEIDLYDENVLILHGDTLCLADENYQRMRKIIHNKFLQCIFNSLPLFYRKKIGWKIRSASQSKKVYKNTDMMGVTQSEVQRLLIKHHSQTLIHGHTHQVAEHRFNINDKPARRFDVGDWYHNMSFVEAKKGSIEIHIQPI